jgi:hypothetical protein
MTDGYIDMTETADNDKDKLEKAVDKVFEKIRDIVFYASDTAKEVIFTADKLGITPEEYLEIVGSYIKDFEKVMKEGNSNVKDS